MIYQWRRTYAGIFAHRLCYNTCIQLITRIGDKMVMPPQCKRACLCVMRLKRADGFYSLFKYSVKEAQISSRESVFVVHVLAQFEEPVPDRLIRWGPGAIWNDLSISTYIGGKNAYRSCHPLLECRKEWCEC